jgi:6-phosphogluconolactonase (cycloisomerase 2 family)
MSFTFQPNTHVISSIVHIAHEYDSEDEQWPIEIEDHDGNLHAVNLKMGEVKSSHSHLLSHQHPFLASATYHLAPSIRCCSTRAPSACTGGGRS